MTVESLPVDKGVGDEVSSGTVNQFGAFEMKATKVGEDSSIQRMIRLVQSADAGKAKIVGLSDRWAAWIVVIALTAAALTWLISGEIIRAVTILVVFCPCALVLATPTAIMAAIGNATKHGFLVREGNALERLAAVKGRPVSGIHRRMQNGGNNALQNRARPLHAGTQQRVDTAVQPLAAVQLPSDPAVGMAAGQQPTHVRLRENFLLQSRHIRAVRRFAEQLPPQPIADAGARVLHQK